MISITKYFKCTFCSYYKRLNVSEQATAQQIKKSFNQLAKKYHPDVNNQSDQQFIKIKEAYDTLKDPDLRSRYDYERIHGKISERRKFYYYYGDNVQSAAKINAAKRARNLIIMGGMLMLSLAIYFINLYSVPMTEH